ncbi:MAG: T9SS type A sorting domain-containing protein [Flavobacteriales bacterium]
MRATSLCFTLFVGMAGNAQLSIPEIQYTMAADGSSPLNNQAVNTGGLVTGVDPTGYFIQNGLGPWTGIHVLDGANTVALGDSVTLLGVVSEVNNRTEIGNVTEFVNVGPFAAPVPVIVTPGTVTVEQWEGVLVKVLDIGATTLPTAPFWEWSAASWQGQVIVDDLMYLYTPVVGNYYSVTGILDQYQADYKLYPRQLPDIEVGIGMGELAGSSVSVFPNPANTSVTLNTGLSGRTEYTLTDATGRMVLGNLNTPECSTIDVSAIPAGVYTLTLRNGSSVRSTLIAVQR